MANLTAILRQTSTVCWKNTKKNKKMWKPHLFNQDPAKNSTSLLWKWSIQLASKRPKGAKYQQKGQQYAWKITLWGCKKMRMLSNESILEQHRYNILGIYLCEIWCNQKSSVLRVSRMIPRQSGYRQLQ